MSFEKIYNEILEENKENFIESEKITDKLKKKNDRICKIILGTLFGILPIIVYFAKLFVIRYGLLKNVGYILVLDIPMFLLILIILFFRIPKPKNEDEKKLEMIQKKIINSIIKKINANFDCRFDKGFPEVIHKKYTNWQCYDSYTSNCLISGEIKEHPIIIGNVKTKISDPNYGIRINYKGICEHIELKKKYHYKIELKKDFSRRARLRMNPSKLEKSFDITYPEGEIQPVQFLIADIMQYLSDLIKKYNMIVEIKIEGNDAFISIPNKYNILHLGLNKDLESWKELYITIKRMIELTKKLIDIDEHLLSEI